MYADDTIYECHNGKAPVKIMDANTSVPYMNDATYDIGKKEQYVDTENNVAIILLEKDNLSYQIQIFWSVRCIVNYYQYLYSFILGWNF